MTKARIPKQGDNLAVRTLKAGWPAPACRVVALLRYGRYRGGATVAKQRAVLWIRAALLGGEAENRHVRFGSGGGISDGSAHHN